MSEKDYQQQGHGQQRMSHPSMQQSGGQHQQQPARHRHHHREQGNQQMASSSSNPPSSSSNAGPPPAKQFKAEDGSRWNGTSQSQSQGQAQQMPLKIDPELQAKMDACKVTRSLQEYMDNFKAPYINDVLNYERLNKIGQGTFGEVFKARCKRTGKMVALKKILMENEKEGFPITAIREVKMLQQLKHENITELIEVCCSKATQYNRDRSTFYLVFAFCDHDLAGLLQNNKVHLSLVHRKTLMKHLLNGLYKIHKSKILHRDMKAANVLLSRDGVLKLADFGLARPFLKSAEGQPRPVYTNRVVTLWYRPPELLLGDRHYTTQIDIWGAGCIMAEMWTRTPIMQGDSEPKQLELITLMCGSINKEVWPDVEKMPYFSRVELKQGCPRVLVQKVGSVMKDPHAISLLDRLLSIDPSKRPDANTALDDEFFYSEPMPTLNVKDLMDKLTESYFEFTAQRGAHANRGNQQRPAGHPGGGPNANRHGNNQEPAGQYRDMIF